MGPCFVVSMRPCNLLWIGGSEEEEKEEERGREREGEGERGTENGRHQFRDYQYGSQKPERWLPLLPLKT